MFELLAASDGMQPAMNTSSTPKHVAILGLGPSLDLYTLVARKAGGRSNYCDEVWAINALGDVMTCDLLFHMDDVRIQEIRAAQSPQSNIAAMLKWLKAYPGQVITSRPHPDYPCLEPFPLEAVYQMFGIAYFNSTAAYAIAYAILIGVEHLSLFGMDFTYPNAHDAEKGRACVEFWLGIAHARGMKITIARASTLMDSCEPFEKRCYGYDTVDLEFTADDTGTKRVIYTERAPERIPTADEIEDQYNHNVHPNPLVSGEAA